MFQRCLAAYLHPEPFFLLLEDFVVIKEMARQSGGFELEPTFTMLQLFVVKERNR